MKEEYKIQVETTGDYKTKKEFNQVVILTPRQYLNLVQQILNFTDDPEVDVPAE